MPFLQVAPGLREEGALGCGEPDGLTVEGVAQGGAGRLHCKVCERERRRKAVGAKARRVCPAVGWVVAARLLPGV